MWGGGGPGGGGVRAAAGRGRGRIPSPIPLPAPPPEAVLDIWNFSISEVLLEKGSSRVQNSLPFGTCQILGLSTPGRSAGAGCKKVVE